MRRTHWSALALALMLGAVVSSAASAAVLGKTTLLLDSRGARVGESTFGDLVADAMRAQFGADVALLQAGALLDGTIPAGSITTDQLHSSLFAPDEPVVLAEVPGRTVLTALERGLSRLPHPAPAFLQVSGLTVTYRIAPNGEVQIQSVLVGTAPLDPGKVYRTALLGSLAKGGGLGYYRIFDGLQPRQTGPGLEEVVSQYVQESGTITIRPGERLRDVTPPKA